MIIQQEKEGWCGVACVQEVLRLKGIKKSQKKIAKDMGATEKDGVSPTKIVEYLRKQELDVGRADISLDCLNELVRVGHFVILDWMSGASDEDGHYSILMPIIETETAIKIEDPEGFGSYRILRREVFEKQWYDFEDGKKIERLAIVIK